MLCHHTVWSSSLLYRLGKQWKMAPAIHVGGLEGLLDLFLLSPSHCGFWRREPADERSLCPLPRLGPYNPDFQISKQTNK